MLTWKFVAKSEQISPRNSQPYLKLKLWGVGKVIKWCTEIQYQPNCPVLYEGNQHTKYWHKGIHTKHKNTKVVWHKYLLLALMEVYLLKWLHQRNRIHVAVSSLMCVNFIGCYRVVLRISLLYPIYTIEFALLLSYTGHFSKLLLLRKRKFWI